MNVKSRSITVLIAVCFIALFYSLAKGSENSKKDIPPWMEDVKLKGKRSTYLIPKGAKRKVVGSQVIIEPPNEYTARRLYEMDLYIEKRFQEFEQNHEMFKTDLEKLNTELIEIKQKIENNSAELKLKADQVLEESVEAPEEIETSEIEIEIEQQQTEQ